MSRVKHIAWAIAALTMAALACNLGPTGESNIEVVILSPADGAEVPAGEEVTVELTIIDPTGVVTREELQVGGAVVATQGIATPPGETVFSVSMIFTPAEAGTVELRALAYDSEGNASEPATVTLEVTEEGEEEEEEEEGEEEDEVDPTPTVDTPPVEDEERGCTNDMDYVADVTIPDGTEMDPGEAFTKTWTIRNSGTCEWGGYQLVFYSDEQMDGPAGVTVPATAAGAVVDVSVDLVAPDTPGDYFSRWTMRSADGILFGDKIFAEIEVVAPVTGDPHVVITDVTVSDNTPEEGDTITVDVEVENQGDEDAEDFDLVVISTYDPSGPNNPDGIENVPTLDPGDTASFSVDVLYSSAGSYTLRVLTTDTWYSEGDPEPNSRGDAEDQSITVSAAGGTETTDIFQIDTGNSGSVIQGGSSPSAYIYVGDTPSNNRGNAFMSWNISSIPPGATIKKARIDWATECNPGGVPGSCSTIFSGLGGLYIKAFYYATLDVGDFAGGGSSIIALGVSPDGGFVDVTDEVSAAYAAGHPFQIFATFQNDTNGNHDVDYLKFLAGSGGTELTVTYEE